MKIQRVIGIWISRYIFLIVATFAANQLLAQSSVKDVEKPETNTFAEAAKILSEYIQIPSLSGNENDAANYLINTCLNKGLFVEIISDSISCVNFAASIYPLSSKKPNIIFLNHIDVVSANSPETWKYPPFQGKIAENKVWGRGSFDNKGLAVVQLSAIERFINQARILDLPYNVTLLSVSGEETGGKNGSSIAARNFREVFTPAVVVGEGGSGIESSGFLPSKKTFFGISVAEKGFLWLRLSCKINTDGHASVAGNDYALKRMVEALYRLTDKRQPIQTSKETKVMFTSLGKNIGGLKGFAVRHMNWWIFSPFLRNQFRQNPELESIFCNKISISKVIDNGSGLNQNAQQAEAILDCRYLPCTGPEAIINLVKKTIKDTLIHISVINASAPQFSTKPDFFYSQLENSLKQIFPEAKVSPILFPASNDNSYFRSFGCPVYGLNPMIVSMQQLKAIHNVDEFIDMEDIECGINVFSHFLYSVQFSGLTPGSRNIADQRKIGH